MISYGETPLVTAFLLFLENYYNRFKMSCYKKCGV